ncbi:MerR family transcriptional regulator [Pseudomonas sp. 32A]|uniref:MerR family transcriptional regulator n=1 Tax=Pseudomonas sp. 32A TaxID=651185 RepID=UPI0040467021
MPQEKDLAYVHRTTAKLTGCTPKAIRLYEQLGLINEPQREGRYRLYNAHHLQIVHLIRKAQVAGFKLAEMGPLPSSALSREA